MDKNNMLMLSTDLFEKCLKMGKPSLTVIKVYLGHIGGENYLEILINRRADNCFGYDEEGKKQQDEVGGKNLLFV